MQLERLLNMSKVRDDTTFKEGAKNMYEIVLGILVNAPKTESRRKS